MTTAEAIESMTDAGEFEILALRVLRIEDEDCKLLEHMGVNAAGKTIANLVDGFCLVPGSSPPRFIMAAFTTEKPENLKRKWLFDHTKSTRARKATPADDGDLIKAARRAEAIRQNYPNAVFIVHLCTNRRLDDELMEEVYKAGEELGLQVKFLGQSRIRDCLDTKPEGQWLRKEHLGIQAELLSFPLLKHLSKVSLQRYGQEFLITPPERFALTTSKRILEESVRAAKNTVHFVTGTSGVGKSVTSYQVLKDHVETGGIGLWIPGEIAARANSLEEAIETTLRLLHPTIQHGAGHVALRLADEKHRLLLVVDDINRGGDPSGTIRKILVWGKPVTTGNTDNESSYTFSMIVPIWERFRSLVGTIENMSSWVNVFPLSRMSEEDGVLCLQSMLVNVDETLSYDRLRVLVEKLGYDPILMAMYTELLKHTSNETEDTLADEVMEKFVNLTLSETANDGLFLEVDYQEALLRLVQSMIRKRNLYPTWNEIMDWLSDHHIHAIRHMVSSGKICRITGRAGEQRFEFRHDRILEYLLSRAFYSMLNEPTDTDYLSDPYYANYLGRAIAINEVSEQNIQWIREHNPLALIASIRFLKEDNAASLKLVNHAKEWLSEATQNSQLTTFFLVNEACKILEETDSPFVLDITSSIRTNTQAALARFVNGDPIAGIIEFSKRSYFPPSISDKYLDNILNRAFLNHRSTLVQGCREILEKNDLDESIRIGALILAGFIASKELAGPVMSAWNASNNKKEILLSALWAACRCSFEQTSDLLEPMISFWSSLPDDREDGISERSGISLELKFAMQRGISEHVIHYLVNVAETNEALRFHILDLLEHVDHPSVVRFIIKLVADVEYRIKENGGFWPWAFHLRENWDPRSERGHRLSHDSLNAIRDLWENPKNEEHLKETAFTFWVSAVDNLDLLQSIPPDHAYFEKALWRRVLMGDSSAIPYVKPLLSSGSKWFHIIDRIWSLEFWDAVDSALHALKDQTPTDFSGGNSNEHHMLSKLLRDISREDAEKLLLKHWEHLKYSKLFVQLALYLGTESSKRAAAEIIPMYPDSNNPFQYIGYFFGFLTQRLSDRLSIAHLESLRPYLCKLDDHTIWKMTEFCMRHGYHSWANQYLRPEFVRRRSLMESGEKEKRDFIERIGKEYYPSEEDLFEELDWIEQQKFHSGHIWHWVEEFAKRHDPPNRWQQVLEKWFTKSPSLSRFKIVQQAIIQHGNRTDLELLAQCAGKITEDETKILLEHAKFLVMRRTLK